MTIISAFMFSDPEEIELVLAKIISEEPLVKNWVIVEGEYSFRGDRKPLILKKMIDTDPRFTQFVGRIHVIEAKQNFLEGFKYPALFLLRKQFEILIRRISRVNYKNQQRALVEKKFFYAENCTRNFAITKILELAEEENTWILISDADEILNLTNEKIRKSIKEIMHSGNLFVMLFRQKYAYDFDNLDSQQRFTPFVSLKALRHLPAPSLSLFRTRFDGTPYVDLPYVVEYTFCFSLEAIFRKLSMFPHVSPSNEAIRESLLINGTALYIDADNSERRWFKKVKLDDQIVPDYIVTNFQKLRTNNIDQNYLENRRLKYPDLFI
jgi:hypothetical protein